MREEEEEEEEGVEEEEEGVEEEEQQLAVARNPEHNSRRLCIDNSSTPAV